MRELFLIMFYAQSETIKDAGIFDYFDTAEERDRVLEALKEETTMYTFFADQQVITE
jgi:hypothetical protein